MSKKYKTPVQSSNAHFLFMKDNIIGDWPILGGAVGLSNEIHSLCMTAVLLGLTAYLISAK